MGIVSHQGGGCSTGIEMASDVFRQDIVFFVDGLPPTLTSLDAGADDSADRLLLTDEVKRGGG